MQSSGNHCQRCVNQHDSLLKLLCMYSTLCTLSVHYCQLKHVVQKPIQSRGYTRRLIFFLSLSIIIHDMGLICSLTILIMHLIITKEISPSEVLKSCRNSCQSPEFDFALGVLMMHSWCRMITIKTISPHLTVPVSLCTLQEPGQN